MRRRWPLEEIFMGIPSEIIKERDDFYAAVEAYGHPIDYRVVGIREKRIRFYYFGTKKVVDVHPLFSLSTGSGGIRVSPHHGKAFPYRSGATDSRAYRLEFRLLDDCKVLNIRRIYD